MDVRETLTSKSFAKFLNFRFAGLSPARRTRSALGTCDQEGPRRREKETVLRQVAIVSLFL